MENGHETWNLEGEKSLLVRVTMDSCRTVSHTFSGSTGGQLGGARHRIGLTILLRQRQ